jgi:D-methionine transport system permease protein
MSDLTLSVLSEDLVTALWETVIMVGISFFLSIVIGIPLGFLVFLTRKGMLAENRFLNAVGGLAINFVRSLPFVILLILVLPFSKLVTGHSTGPYAASVPLSIASIAFFARLVEVALCEVDRGVIEAAAAMGAKNGLIIREILFPEALPGLVRGLTVTVVSLIGYSAMAGVVGGGGIGFLAINYGYYRYETGVMIATVIVLIAIVQLVQWLGDRRADRIVNRRK